MLQLRLVILSLLICSGLFAIEKKKQTNFNVSVNSFLSSGEDLPFWITSNRNGVFSLKNSNYQLLQAGFTRELEIKSIRKWDYTWGLNLVSGFGGKTDFQANQYWFGLRRKWFVIKAGAQSDPILYEGLSSTNGNLDRSNNARPLPGITFSTNDYIPFFFWKSWFTFNAKFEEKLFSKHTFVNDAHLHHKSLYLRASLPKNWSVTGGFEHFVLWGGTSPTVEGKMPGFDQYFRYILAQKAGPGALKDDQKNKSGNQLGLYSLEIKKEWSKSSIAFYWNHPFEDLSGITLVNWRDGLWGLHLNNKNQSALITDVVYEYMYTLHQSGPDHLIPAPTPDDPSRLTGRGKDNYFDSYIYRSFAYYNRMNGTPLFVHCIG